MDDIQYTLLELIKYNPSKELTEMGLLAYNNWMDAAFKDTVVKYGEAHFRPKSFELGFFARGASGEYHLIQSSDGFLFWMFQEENSHQETGPIPIEKVKAVHKTLIGYQVIEATTSTNHEQRSIGFTSTTSEDEGEVVPGQVFGDEKMAGELQLIRESIDRVADILREVLVVVSKKV